MPARKRNLVILPHAMAVDLAPDSADKRAVVETANARFVLLNGDLADRDLGLLAQLQQNVSRLLASPMPDDQCLRLMAFCLRLAGQGSRLRAERGRIREQAFTFARTGHYAETGVRVGPLFNPIEAEATELDTSIDTAPAKEAAAEEAPEPVRESAINPAPQASNKQIKACVRTLKESKVDASTREQFRRQAQTERWGKDRLEAELRKLLAA